MVQKERKKNNTRLFNFILLQTHILNLVKKDYQQFSFLNLNSVTIFVVVVVVSRRNFFRTRFGQMLLF